MQTEFKTTGADGGVFFVGQEASDHTSDLATVGLTPEHELALVGIGLGAMIGKIGLAAVTDVKTGEHKAALVALPPDGLEGEFPPIPLAVLIDGDPFEQYAPYGVDIAEYLQAA